MVCCRNVPLMPTLFLKLRRYGNGKMANLSISTAPLKFEDVPERNAFEYLQMIYIASNTKFSVTELRSCNPYISFHVTMFQIRTL